MCYCWMILNSSTRSLLSFFCSKFLQTYPKYLEISWFIRTVYFDAVRIILLAGQMTVFWEKKNCFRNYITGSSGEFVRLQSLFCSTNTFWDILVLKLSWLTIECKRVHFCRVIVGILCIRKTLRASSTDVEEDHSLQHGNNVTSELTVRTVRVLADVGNMLLLFSWPYSTWWYFLVLRGLLTDLASLTHWLNRPNGHEKHLQKVQSELVMMMTGIESQSWWRV